MKFNNRMKQYKVAIMTLGFTLLSGLSPLLAQVILAKNAFQGGIGYVSMSGPGIMYYGQYTRRLSAYVHLGGLAGYAHSSWNQMPWQDTRTKLLLGEVNVYLLPFSTIASSASLLRTIFRLHTLKLGAGVGARYLDEYKLVGSALSGQLPDQYAEYYKARWQGGFVLAVEYELVAVRRFFLGFRAALHTYDGGEAADFVGGHVGVKF